MGYVRACMRVQPLEALYSLDPFVTTFLCACNVKFVHPPAKTLASVLCVLCRRHADSFFFTLPHMHINESIFDKTKTEKNTVVYDRAISGKKEEW
jgi:hypothetical protein